MMKSEHQSSPGELTEDERVVLFAEHLEALTRKYEIALFSKDLVWLIPMQADIWQPTQMLATIWWNGHEYELAQGKDDED